MTTELTPSNETLDDEPMPLGQIRDQQAHEVLAAISDALRLDGLVLDDENQCVFTINKKFVFLVYFDYGASYNMSFSLPLGFLPQSKSREPLLANLMAANYCWSMTDGGVLGLDEDSGCITLTKVVELPVKDNGQVTEMIAGMISIGEYWIDQIAAAQDDNGQTGAAGDSAPQFRV